jgi:surface protein
VKHLNIILLCCSSFHKVFLIISILSAGSASNMKYSNAALFVLLISLSASIAVADVTCFPNKITLLDAIDNALAATGSGVGYNDATYGPIENWCFDSSLTSFSFLFSYQSNFNADISGWDVSNVKNMEYLVRFNNVYGFML